MTLIGMASKFEAVEWNEKLSLTNKVEILKNYLNIKSLTDVPFWKFYSTIKKLNSL